MNPIRNVGTPSWDSSWDVQHWVVMTHLEEPGRLDLVVDLANVGVADAHLDDAV